MNVYVNGERWVLPESENLLNDTSVADAILAACDKARGTGDPASVEVTRNGVTIASYEIRGERHGCSDFGNLWSEGDYIAAKRELAERREITTAIQEKAMLLAEKGRFEEAYKKLENLNYILYETPAKYQLNYLRKELETLWQA